jgi:flagellar capping protein FliD
MFSRRKEPSLSESVDNLINKVEQTRTETTDTVNHTMSFIKGMVSNLSLAEDQYTQQLSKIDEAMEALQQQRDKVQANFNDARNFKANVSRMLDL